MTEPLIGITPDCSDLDVVVAFWRQALQFVDSDKALGGDTFHTIFAPRGRSGLHHLTIQKVPETKTAKNRAHLDLFVNNADHEVERLTGSAPIGRS